MLVLTVFLFLLFMYVTLALRSGGAQIAGSRLRHEREQARWLAESGVQKAVICLSAVGAGTACGGWSGLDYVGEDFSIAGGTVDVDVSGTGNERVVRSIGTYRGSTRTILTRARNFSKASFAAAMQGGGSGAVLRNNAHIIGSVYLNGSILCLPGAGITGSATVAGETGSIDGCEVDGDAQAHEIRNSVVAGDAWYQAISGTSVSGALHPDSPDPATVPFPLTDQQIDLWRAEAEDGGVIQGNVVVSGDGPHPYGPVRITGDLTIGNNATLTMTGTIFVDGRVTTGNGSVVRLDPSYQERSGVLAAEGNIDAGNTVSFYGSGDSASVLLIVTRSLSVSETDPAIFIGNNASNSLFYANRGLIHVKNNALVNGLVGERLLLDENTSAVYLPAATDLDFSPQSGVVASLWLEMAGSRAE